MSDFRLTCVEYAGKYVGIKVQDSTDGTRRRVLVQAAVGDGNMIRLAEAATIEEAVYIVVAMRAELLDAEYALRHRIGDGTADAPKAET